MPTNPFEHVTFPPRLPDYEHNEDDPYHGPHTQTSIWLPNTSGEQGAYLDKEDDSCPDVSGDERFQHITAFTTNPKFSRITDFYGLKTAEGYSGEGVFLRYATLPSVAIINEKTTEINNWITQTYGDEERSEVPCRLPDMEVITDNAYPEKQFLEAIVRGNYLLPGGEAGLPSMEGPATGYTAFEGISHLMPALLRSREFRDLASLGAQQTLDLTRLKQRYNSCKGVFVPDIQSRLKAIYPTMGIRGIGQAALGVSFERLDHRAQLAYDLAIINNRVPDNGPPRSTGYYQTAVQVQAIYDAIAAINGSRS